MRVESFGCTKHNGNTCGVRIFPAGELVGLVDPLEVCKCDFLNSKEMWAYIYSHFVGKYYVVNAQVGKYKKFREEHSSHFLREYYVGSNQQMIKPLGDVHNKPTFTNVEISPMIKPIAQRMFKRYLLRVTGLNLNVDIGPPPEGKVESLFNKCLRVLDWSRLLFEPVKVGENYYKRIFYSTNSYDYNVGIRLFKTFSRDTTYRGTTTVITNRLLPYALKMLFTDLHGNKYSKSLNFVYDLKKIIRDLRLSTGGGVLLQKFGAPIEGVKQSQVGAKAVMVVPAAQELHHIVTCILTGKRYRFTPICTIRIKGEMKLFYLKMREELVKAQDKKREYFIPGLVLTMISIMFSERMNLECGPVIKIGIKWWYGGAYYLAKQLNCDVPDMFWVDGDIDAFDKSIMDVWLYIYIVSCRYYYNVETMVDKQRLLFEELLKILTYHFVNKVVLHVGDFWTLLKGVMYSGGKETSHGDSFILALYFYIYINVIIDENPDAADLIRVLIQKKLIAIVVYGDDHIWCCPRILHGIINLQSWTDFLRRFCRSDLRDGMEYTSFFSEMDQVTGRLTKKGPVFLKRYFVRNFDGIRAPVLPVRETTSQILKLLATDRDNKLDLILSGIGHLWDSMGTNECTYTLIKDLITDLRSTEIMSYQTMIDLMREDAVLTRKLNDLVRKIDISAEEVLAQFPTRRRLFEMHIMDPNKAAFGNFVVEENKMDMDRR